MSPNTTLIKNAILLNSLPQLEVLDHLKNGKFRIVSYEKGNVLHFEGEPCKKLELILSGKILVERIHESGNLLTIAEFTSGDSLGGNILFSTHPYYPLTVSAQLSSVVLEIDRGVLFQLLSKNPHFLRTFLEHISDHTFILGNKIKHNVRRTIRESLLSYLIQERQRQNSSCIKLTITKKALAERIGVQRTSLSRELAKMRDDGLISLNKDTITLL